MNTEKVISSLLDGLNKGAKEFDIDYNVIICAMRHFSEEDNYNMIKTSYEFLGNGVCAADLAGAEASYPMSEFMNLFDKIRKSGMPFTIHAGECGSVKNILDSVEVGARRIGHGIAMTGHPEVQAFIKEKRIGIEMCPISNLQTKAVKTKEEYPIKEFLNSGILVTVNTDNRTVSNTSLVKELEFIQQNYGITDEEIKSEFDSAPNTYKIAVMNCFFCASEEELDKAIELVKQHKSINDIATELDKTLKEEHTYYESDIVWYKDLNNCSVGDIVYTTKDSGSYVVGAITELHSNWNDEKVKTELENKLYKNKGYEVVNKEFEDFLKTKEIKILGEDFSFIQEEAPMEEAPMEDVTDDIVVDNSGEAVVE